MRGEPATGEEVTPIETLRPSHSHGEASITPGARLVNAYDFMTSQLLAALIAVESGGDDLARGRHGELGALQVRPCVVKDVNRIAGTHYRWAEMTNRWAAMGVFKIYTGHYCATGRLGRAVTDQDRARTWHGGPTGWKRRQTLVYWKRVRVQIMRARMGAS